MSTTTKRKGRKAPKAAKELRVQCLVLVDADGRECGRLQADTQGTRLRLADPGTNFAVELRCEAESAGLTVDYLARRDTLVASLMGWAEPTRGVHGYGVLSLQDDKGDVQDGGSDRHTAKAEELDALNRLAEWLPTVGEPDDVRMVVRLVRRLHEINPGRFEAALHYLCDLSRDADLPANGAVRKAVNP